MSAVMVYFRHGDCDIAAQEVTALLRTQMSDVLVITSINDLPADHELLSVIAVVGPHWNAVGRQNDSIRIPEGQHYHGRHLIPLMVDCRPSVTLPELPDGLFVTDWTSPVHITTADLTASINSRHDLIAPCLISKILGHGAPNGPDCEALHRASVDYASFGRRLSAYLIDVLALAIIGLLLGELLGESIRQNAQATMTQAEYFRWFNGPGSFDDASTRGLLIGLGLHALYFVPCWVLAGRTLGMALLQIELVTEDSGQRLRLGGALVRLIGLFIGSIPLFIGWLWMLWDENSQTWHDLMANTVVIHPLARKAQAYPTLRPSARLPLAHSN